ncbi:MAG: hypothetical protein M3439_06375, partial [Chloroflexota bacterium]|nr:hypothetical protein [Chloroflexota bacterium]
MSQNVNPDQNPAVPPDGVRAGATCGPDTIFDNDIRSGVKLEVRGLLEVSGVACDKRQIVIDRGSGDQQICISQLHSLLSK